jgi:hypothetical protein
MAITFLDGREAGPEGARERNPPHRRLQVEADQRHLAGDDAAVLDDLVLAGVLHGAQA